MNPHLLYVLHALTPLHVGVDEGLGAIDLPTMRERHTGYPLLPGSSVKGVLREEAEIRLSRDSDDVLGAFGPPQAQAGDFRGGLVFTDALLLALPVRSLCGTFAWVSCPHVLGRLCRDLELAGLELPAFPAGLESTESGLVPDGSEGRRGSALLVPATQPSQVFLEEKLLRVDPDRRTGELAERLAAWLWPEDPEAQGFFLRRFLLVHDDLFAFFTRIGLEVRARVKIDDERGTAAQSGPWTEEHMPAETLLYGLALGRPTLVARRASDGAEATSSSQAPARKQAWGPERSLRVLRGVASEGPLLRFGGHATIGLGRARFRVVESAGQKGGGAP